MTADTTAHTEPSNEFEPKMLEGELRVLDVDLATWLGFDRPRDIRKLIRRYEVELERLGQRATVARRPEQGGHAVIETYLNKKQAMLITTKSDTSNAIDATIRLIERFDAYERGEIAAPRVSAADMDHSELNAKVGFSRQAHRNFGKLGGAWAWKEAGLPTPPRELLTPAMRIVMGLDPFTETSAEEARPTQTVLHLTIG